MEVRNVMSRDVEFAPADYSVQQAAELMGEIDVGGVPVGDADRPLGVVTARDLLLRVCAAGRDPAATPVADVMTAELHHCRAEDALETALDLMASRQVRRLLVRDAGDRVVGWVTLSDISRRLLIDSDIVRGGLSAISERAQAR